MPPYRQGYPANDGGEESGRCAIVDRMREANAKLFGIQDVTLDAVRESRNSQ